MIYDLRLSLGKMTDEYEEVKRKIRRTKIRRFFKKTEKYNLDELLEEKKQIRMMLEHPIFWMNSTIISGICENRTLIDTKFVERFCNIGKRQIIENPRINDYKNSCGVADSIQQILSVFVKDLSCEKRKYYIVFYQLNDDEVTHYQDFGYYFGNQLFPGDAPLYYFCIYELV